ncbi:MAG: hypothetical protein CL484_03020 [Acidobacteria bacterium]|nr:hypothetical protein [Acidobacteriota bacterium]|tara:strand:+ start:52 stop:375 length:324 start_codon:yes stop_codon:yes gene_type:complete
MTKATQKASTEEKDDVKTTGPDQRTQEPNELAESAKAKLDEEGKLDDQNKINDHSPSSDAVTEDAPKKEKKLYTLSKGYWDGRVLHPRGSQVYFAEGTAPRGSELVK